jgi:nitrate reductase gamma subunit
MATAGYADPARYLGRSVPKVWSGSPTRSRFGDIVLVLFLLAQCLDGVLTYVGVRTFGVEAEANPLIAAMMLEFGAGAALIGAKSVAGMLGIALHIRQVHGAVAGLTLFYATIAVAPWTAILVIH